MKTMFTLMLTTLLLSSCEKPNVSKTETQYKLLNSGAPLDLVVIDSCEYLFGDWGYSTVLTHKGNCTNHVNK